MISQQCDEAAAPPQEAAVAQLQEILASILATDSRGTIAFTPSGRLILANAGVGAVLVARWHNFGSSEAWPSACAQARERGSAEVRLESGEQGELHAILAENGAARFYLLRLTGPDHGDPHHRLGERLAEMAHDLRAPLQSLIIAADGLGNETGDGREAEIGALARLALDQVRNLLETLRMEEVSADFEPEDVFDLTGLVADMAKLVGPICRRSGNSIVTELPAEASWHRGAPHLIRAILQNLITNANRFNMNGPVTVRLKLEPTEGGRDKLVTLEIEDTGPGLSEAERQLVLAPRRGMRPAGAGEGYGLGLGIVARAVSRLRGTLEVGPGRETGTLFRIRFPLTIAAAPQNTGSELQGQISLSGLHILVVEDNPVNLAILLRALSDAGAEAEGVVNGSDALQRVLGNPGRFDVVLLDVTLPDIDGIEVARQIRAGEAEGEHLLIVGLTAHVGAVIHGSGLAAGMDHILIKPVRPSELRIALRDVKQGARPKQQVPQRMQSPEMMLDHALVLELSEEMGHAAALGFMRKALEEARAVLQSAEEGMESPALRAKIHSAIGSSGLTGLSGLEYALRHLQVSVRGGETDREALDLAAQMIGNTAIRIEQFAAEG